MLVVRSVISWRRKVSAGPTALALSARSVERSARPTIVSVSRDISSPTSITVPERQRATVSLAARAMSGANAAILSLWKAGCERRRCRRQASSSAVTRPSPIKARRSCRPRGSFL